MIGLSGNTAGVREAIKKLTSAVNKIKSSTPKVASYAAEGFARHIKAVIETQQVEGPPLAAATVAAKGHDRKLIDTEAYLNSIQAEGNVVHLDGEQYRRHEFGTRYIPARPHVDVAMRTFRESRTMSREAIFALLDL